MSKTVLIMVTDNQENVENAKKYWEHTDVSFQVYSPTQWREGLDNNFFRQQLVQGVPALSTGHRSLGGYGTGNVLAFPQGSSTPDSRVQKMEEMEAVAIENAIAQYKGNLTEAAKALGIGRATLYRKVKQYKIDPSVARRKKQIAA